MNVRELLEFLLLLDDKHKVISIYDTHTGIRYYPELSEIDLTIADHLEFNINTSD